MSITAVTNPPAAVQSSSGPTTVVLGNDHSITSSTVLENTTLTFTAVAGKTYYFKAYLRFTNLSAASVKVFVDSTDTTAKWFVQWILQAGTNYSSGIRTQHYTNAFPAGTIAGNAVTDIIHLWEGQLTAVNGGAFTIQFAQNTSNATPTVMKADSFIQYQQMN